MSENFTYTFTAPENREDPKGKWKFETTDPNFPITPETIKAAFIVSDDRLTQIAFNGADGMTVIEFIVQLMSKHELNLGMLREYATARQKHTASEVQDSIRETGDVPRPEGDSEVDVDRVLATLRKDLGL